MRKLQWFSDISFQHYPFVVLAHWSPTLPVSVWFFTSWINNHTPSKAWNEIIYPIPKFSGKFGMDKYSFTPQFCTGCEYLSMPRSKLSRIADKKNHATLKGGFTILQDIWCTSTCNIFSALVCLYREWKESHLQRILRWNFTVKSWPGPTCSCHICIALL